MCVNDAKYSAALVKKEEAETEKTRCENAIEYYKLWLGKIEPCIEVISSMISQNKIIAGLCGQIIVNGHTIDSGGHFNGQGAAYYTSGLENINSALNSIANGLRNVLEQLDSALFTANEDLSAAKEEIRIYKYPCGTCAECLALLGTQPSNNIAKPTIKKTGPNRGKNLYEELK